MTNYNLENLLRWRCIGPFRGGTGGGCGWRSIRPGHFLLRSRGRRGVEDNGCGHLLGVRVGWLL